jgi:O-antigen biosynthesis protein WbqP
MLKRLFDLAFVLASLVFAAVPTVLIALAIRWTSDGPLLYWSDRVGKNNQLFRMPKFRTMRLDAPTVATHLMPNPDDYVTPVGRFLRRTSLDELPQLWSILIGDMSVVGPRPALYNQDDLIALRSAAGVDTLLPGLTGWAQVNGRDELPVPEKVRFDIDYLQRRSLWFDLKIIFLTGRGLLIESRPDLPGTSQDRTGREAARDAPRKSRGRGVEVTGSRAIW